MVTAPARIVPSHAAPADPMSLVRPVAVGIVDVWKSFGATTVLKGVSVTIGKGEFFSLLGPSGCGKTTLLRMIGGFEAPTAGEIRIDGKDVGGLPPYARATNMIFQQLALFPHLDVFENVAFGLRVQKHPRGDIAAKVKEALALVRLEGFERRMPDQLSGGQRQRVAMARAIVNEPSVLLLDEPLGALDLKLRMQMQLELKRIQREVGTTFMYVTHDQGEAMTMSDQIAVMNKGRIDQLDTPQAIYDQPATRFVASFIGNTNLIPVEIAEITGPTAKVRLGGLEFSARTGAAADARTGVVSIRYERIRLGAEALQRDTRARAVIRDAIFSGSAILYVVVLENSETELTAEVSHDGTSVPIVKGTVVDIGWDGGATTLFADE